MGAPRLFSYVVDHDLGFAPNPYGGYCSLVHCKFGGAGGRRNIVEMASPGDWILGSGGAGPESAGVNRIVYLMRVDEKLSFSRFLADPGSVDGTMPSSVIMEISLRSYPRTTSTSDATPCRALNSRSHCSGHRFSNGDAAIAATCT